MKHRGSNRLVVLSLLATFMFSTVYNAGAIAPGPKVSEDKNKHNLSSAVYNTASNPSAFVSLRDASITYKATFDAVNNPQGRQICIFCHTPHNANVAEQSPLWNRKFSGLTNFGRYSSNTLQIRVKPATSALAQYQAGSQPDGSSKLCLSCHDGVSGLGDVRWGGPIDMGANSVITGIASFNPTSNPNKMKFGHHPVSFIYNGPVQQAISSGRFAAGASGGFVLPGGSSPVKLDRNSKMQCNTCHDPHQNKSHDDACYNGVGTVVACDAINTRKAVPFWVLHSGANNATQDHDAVCTTCHRLIATTPTPWPFP